MPALFAQWYKTFTHKFAGSKNVTLYGSNINNKFGNI